MRRPNCGSHPAPSADMFRQLERFLGTELFVRRSNGVTLTPAGNLYARKVSRIVRDLRRATAAVRKPDTAVAPMIQTPVRNPYHIEISQYVETFSQVSCISKIRHKNKCRYLHKTCRSLSASRRRLAVPHRKPAFPTRIWRRSDSLLIINELMLTSDSL